MTSVFNLSVNQREAIALLSGTVPPSLTKKIVTGIKVAAIGPLGAKAAIISKGRTRVRKAALAEEAMPQDS